MGSLLGQVAPSDLAPGWRESESGDFLCSSVHPQRVRTVVDRLRQARHTESTAHRMGAVAIAPGSAKRGRIVQRPHADQPVARLPAGGWRLAAGGGRLQVSRSAHSLLNSSALKYVSQIVPIANGIAVQSRYSCSEAGVASR